MAGRSRHTGKSNAACEKGTTGDLRYWRPHEWCVCALEVAVDTCRLAAIWRWPVAFVCYVPKMKRAVRDLYSTQYCIRASYTVE